jgi:hypothetical protein
MVKDTFLNEALRAGVSEELALLVYETLIDSYRVKQVTIDADLYRAFGIVDDELDQVVVEVAEKAGLQLPGAAETAGMPPVRTVKDLLLFLNGLRSVGQ